MLSDVNVLQAVEDVQSNNYLVIFKVRTKLGRSHSMQRKGVKTEVRVNRLYDRVYIDVLKEEMEKVFLKQNKDQANVELRLIILS